MKRWFDRFRPRRRAPRPEDGRVFDAQSEAHDRVVPLESEIAGLAAMPSFSVPAPSKPARRALAYAIDFGTSNSQIGVAYADGVELVEVEPGPLPENLPSVIALHRNGNRTAGTAAIHQYLLTAMDKTHCGSCDKVTWSGYEPSTKCKQYERGNGCMDSRLLAGLKSDLSDGTFDATESWALRFTPSDLVSVILVRLRKAADERVGGVAPRRLVLGHPVRFPGAEGSDAEGAQRLALDRLVDAATAAGFEEVVLFPEPSAALEDPEFGQGRILAADFGGGTFDAAVIEAPRVPGQVVAGIAGTAIGGEEFDGLLFDEKVAPALGLTDGYVDAEGRERVFPARFRVRLRTLGGIRHVLADRAFAATLREFKAYQGGERLVVLEEVLYGGFTYDLYRAIEQAKMELSSYDVVSIRVQRGRTLDLDIPVTRQEFERLIAPALERIDRTIDEALDDAGVTAEMIDRVVRTGGSSSIPAFRELLDGKFGAEKVQERGPFTAVVTGLAHRAQALWA